MATYSLQISPFDVPTSVKLEMPLGRREDGMRHAPVVPLGNLDRETLDNMIEELKNSIIEEWTKQTGR